MTNRFDDRFSTEFESALVGDSRPGGIVESSARIGSMGTVISNNDDVCTVLWSRTGMPKITRHDDFLDEAHKIHAKAAKMVNDAYGTMYSAHDVEKVWSGVNIHGVQETQVKVWQGRHKPWKSPYEYSMTGEITKYDDEYKWYVV